MSVIIILVIALISLAVLEEKKNRSPRKWKYRVHYFLLLRRELEVRTLEDAYNKIRELKEHNAKIEKKILDASKLKADTKLKKDNQDICFSILDNLNEDSRNYNDILDNPMSVIQKAGISSSNLYLTMSDLRELVSYTKSERKSNENQREDKIQHKNGNNAKPNANVSNMSNQKKIGFESSSDKTNDTTIFKSDIGKGLLQPILCDAQRYSQVKQYEHYFINISKAANRSLYGLAQCNDNKYNVRILLMYLSQLYSISKVIGEIFNNQKKDKKSGDKSAASYKASVQPFCEKIATIDDIVAIKDKGEPFEHSGGDEDTKLIEYLKKYKPLDFNLLGVDYHEYL